MASHEHETVESRQERVAPDSIDLSGDGGRPPSGWQAAVAGKATIPMPRALEKEVSNFFACRSNYIGRSRVPTNYQLTPVNYLLLIILVTSCNWQLTSTYFLVTT